MTHFACAEEGDGVVVREQQRLFEKAIQELPGARSLANSAAIFTRPDSHRDWIRPGLALYGASPFVEGTGASLGLKPVMHLISRLLSIQPVQAGDAVGYGHAFRFTRPGHLGIVAVGYGDGYPRGAPYGTPVLLHTAQRKIEVPLVGRVSMDMLAVDLSDIPLSELEIGQPVTLWGSDLPVEGVARRLGTVAYELLAGVSGRVPIIVQSNDGGPR